MWTSTAVFSSDAHTPEEIPHDVQIVMLYLDPPLRQAVMGLDEYDIDGVVVRGAYMDQQAFEEVVCKAFDDMAWPA